MKRIAEKVKRLASSQINRSVSKQKYEWPATSTPVYFQPERPQKVVPFPKEENIDLTQ